MGRNCTFAAWILICCASSTAWGQGWVNFVDETATRAVIADPTLFQTDPNEKDYAKGDFDNDGDIDLIIVRKQPYTTLGRRRNVLMMNEGIAEGHAINGVLVDRTVEFATDATDGGQGFLDLTNDRDVAVGDFNGDGWLDFVTVSTLGDGLPKTISHPRIYMNKGAIAGVWQGFRYEEARFPQLFTIPGGLAVAPRLCSVAVGDVTGDGRPDIYIGDYDSSGVGGGTPENPANDVNDRLLINDGNGFFVDSNQTRMNSTMLLSAFGVAAHFADMNGDGLLDVVRDTALNAPRHVSISYNNPANVGFFQNYQVVDQNAPYHITTGDLNNDNRLDILVTDDGADHYWLNQGNGPDGRATFVAFDVQRFTGVDGEFGGNQRLADLNNDGFLDALIADQDVDIEEQCSRRLHIYRNLGNVPNVTLQEQDNGRPWTHNGTFEIEVFDLNGDGWNDLIVGHCAGTNIWINVPPTNLTFSYPDGLPGTLVPDEPTNFRVSVAGVGATPQGNTGRQYVSIDGGPFVETAMTQLQSNVYLANLPAVPCTSTARFYFSARTTTNQLITDPGNAPTTSYSALASLGTTTILDERFESPNPSWTVTNHPSLTGGAWERVNPNGTFFPDGSQTPAQPENDAGQPADETMCYITQQYPGSGSSSNSDVDGGPTILTSPTFNIEGSDGIVSYARWLFCSDAANPAQRDPLVTEINNGTSGWVFVHQTFSTANFWEVVSFRVSDYVTPSATVQVRFSVADPGTSVTEAGIDNFKVLRILCPEPCTTNEQCDDGLFCNGEEICGGDGFCQPGETPCPGQACDENQDICVQCVSDAACSDGFFCNGVEVCVNGVCQDGPDPCNEPLVCDEQTDSCVGCTNDGQCDDGSFCNGPEFCINNACVGTSPFIGVQNNGFDGAAGWTTFTTQGGTITFPSALNVVGPNTSQLDSLAHAFQATIDFNGQNFEFDLLQYTSGDTESWDRPFISIDGVNYGLNHDGTLGNVIPANFDNVATYGTIRNAQPANSPIHFSINIQSLVGPGPHTIGFGVASVDGLAGAGTARFDTVLPAYAAFEACPGELCSNELAACVTCLNDLACSDGQFCNGVEHCLNGECVAGDPPCPAELCDEVNDTCATQVQPWVGQPVSNLGGSDMQRFLLGQTKFDANLDTSQGLGPIFNQSACGACHNQGGLGGSGTSTVTRFGFAHKGGFDDLADYGGSLLQASFLSEACRENIPEQANIIALRLTTPNFGIGLIEAIPDADILAHADNPPPGVSGRAHMVPAFEDGEGAPLRVGRFGWKAQVPTVLTFSADASLNEMGLTNRFLTEENDPNGIFPPSIAECDTIPDPEDGPEGGVPGAPHFIDRVTDFQRLLAAPPQTPRFGMSGETVFNAIGCNKCHVSSFTTGTVAEAALSGKIIKPYSDFLLHDMGTLGDGIQQGDAGVTEMRTSPLWGLRHRTKFLHDGRASGGSFAQRVVQAIAEHGGEGAASSAAFDALASAQKDALIAFLDSLGRREFDHDGNNLVDGFDLNVFADCYSGPGHFYSPDDACAISDFDQDGDVDDDDYAVFLTVYTGSIDDCNNNSVVDATDIVAGTSRDCNLNGIPDECDPDASNIALFVSQVLLDVQNPIYVCMFDQDASGSLDGADIQPFVDGLINP
ncbi:MAG: VCBS repeat-containing protein [Phycisphaerae bacterium]|nr:VCBS repeat-containing protein [Phycisphaerae bacterium]